MRTCIVDGCVSKHIAKGYCSKHYLRFKKFGDPLITLQETHNMSGTPEYRAWNSMKNRCYNKKNGNYRWYGGRGIKVCDRWLHSFSNFYEDMGNKPFNEAQIDRINNDGNYQSNNCQWITGTENTRKQPQVKLSMKEAREIRLLSTEKTNKELSEIYGVVRNTISRIINNKRWAE